ncbi:unnamed protein product, partial [Mesorhabditis spiculigera]
MSTDRICCGLVHCKVAALAFWGLRMFLLAVTAWIWSFDDLDETYWFGLLIFSAIICVVMGIAVIKDCAKMTKVTYWLQALSITTFVVMIIFLFWKMPSKEVVPNEMITMRRRHDMDTMLTLAVLIIVGIWELIITRSFYNHLKHHKKSADLSEPFLREPNYQSYSFYKNHGDGKYHAPMPTI